jgi:Zn-dependent metalloprotease
MSDVFGAVCETYGRAWQITPDTWKIGEGSTTPSVPGDALRYMDNPTADGISTDWYPERYSGVRDSGGVHFNSGITNLAFKLLVTGAGIRGASRTSRSAASASRRRAACSTAR